MTAVALPGSRAASQSRASACSMAVIRHLLGYSLYAWAESDPAKTANPAAATLTSTYAVTKIVLQSPQDWAYTPQTPQLCGVCGV